MEPIKELREEIVAFGDRLKFENFEDTQKGHLAYDLPARWLVEDEEPWVTHDFYMRVGLHLGRVMQVIMSCGHFVKMRKEDRWTKEYYPGMVALDPTQPHLSLYRNYNAPGQYAVSGPLPFGFEHWRPDLNYTFNPYHHYNQQLGGYNPYAGQGSLAPYGGGGGGLGSGYSTGTLVVPTTTVWTTTAPLQNVWTTTTTSNTLPLLQSQNTP